MRAPLPSDHSGPKFPRVKKKIIDVFSRLFDILELVCACVSVTNQKGGIRRFRCFETLPPRDNSMFSLSNELEIVSKLAKLAAQQLAESDDLKNQNIQISRRSREI